mmetsp:Transcript_12287/g.18619  ORF Transcript_12287/g.18619 Transcript_12287/m.18619 type:complete len:312 (+) Transcript_12287:43-978(+)
MLSRLKSSDNTRRPFDDLANIVREESDDEEVPLKWNKKKTAPSTNKSDTVAPKKNNEIGIDKENKPYIDEKENKQFNKPNILTSPSVTSSTFRRIAEAKKTPAPSFAAKNRLTPIKSSSEKSNSSGESGFLSTPCVTNPEDMDEKWSTPMTSSSRKHSRPYSDTKQQYYDHLVSSVQECSLSPQKDEVTQSPESKGLHEHRDLESEMEIERVFSKVRHNRFKVVEEALREGFDPHSVDNNGNSLLHICAQNNLSKMANLCLQYGSDVNAYNKKGLTPLDYCDNYNFDKMADWLVTMGAENGFIHLVKPENK